MAVYNTILIAVWARSGAVFPTHVLPAHALNVFIPLVDLTPQSGATQFALGTHKLGAHAMPIRFETAQTTTRWRLRLMTFT
eukprot:4303741-Pleurochrysis_carterae.AAC.1